MRRLLIVVAIWVSGLLSAIAGMGMAGGWYEYRFFAQPSGFSPAAILQSRINNDGWEIVPDLTVPELTSQYLRRPRIFGLFHYDTTVGADTLVVEVKPLPTNTAAAAAP